MKQGIHKSKKEKKKKVEMIIIVYNAKQFIHMIDNNKINTSRR